VKIPPEVPSEAADLLKILLNKNPLKRFNDDITISNYHYDTLKWHPFFSDINFEDMWN
jgi:hypothetical protein